MTAASSTVHPQLAIGIALATPTASRVHYTTCYEN
jgi:hypothetical protein